MKLKHHNYIIYFLIFVSCLILLSPFLQSKYVMGHDSFFHTSTLLSLNDTINSGNWFFPKILPNIANNFGYGTGLFYSPLPHLLTIFIYKMINVFYSISIFNVMKIVHFLGLFLSGVFLFNFVMKISKNKWASFLASIIYISFPYRLSEIFVRDAYAESLTFVFLPLILSGVYELLFNNDKKKFYLPFIIGSSGLILTHNITTIFTIYVMIIFLLLNIRKLLNKEVIYCLFKAIFIILGLTSFYTIPLIDQMLHTNTNVFSINAVSSPETVYQNALNISKLFQFQGSQSFDGIQFFLLTPIIFMIILSLIKIINVKKDNSKVFFQFFILGAILLFMTTKLFPWSLMPKSLIYIQFPFRLLVFCILFFSCFSIYFILDFKGERLKNIVIILTIIFIMGTMNILNLDRLRSYSPEDINISQYGIGALNDYLPVNTVNNLEYFNNRKDDAIILNNGIGDISIIKKQAPFIKFVSSNINEKIDVEFPLLYYSGYHSVCSGTPTEPFITKESDKGFLVVEVDKNCEATIDFTGNSYTKASYTISFITLCYFIGFYLCKVVKK